MVRDLVAGASRDVLVGGPHLAGEAMRAGLVDRIVLYVWPIVLGGRNRALPADVRRDLALADVHRVASDVVRLTYRAT